MNKCQVHPNPSHTHCCIANTSNNVKWLSIDGTPTYPSRREFTNQASEDELKQYLHEMHHRIVGDYDGDPYEEHPYQDEAKAYFWEDEAKRLQQLICTEKLKLLDEVIHQSTVNLKSAGAVAGWAELRKEQLEAEL